MLIRTPPLWTAAFCCWLAVAGAAAFTSCCSPRARLQGDWEAFAPDGDKVALEVSGDGTVALTCAGLRLRGSYRFLAADLVEFELGLPLLGRAGLACRARVRFPDADSVSLTNEATGAEARWHRPSRD